MFVYFVRIQFTMRQLKQSLNVLSSDFIQKQNKTAQDENATVCESFLDNLANNFKVKFCLLK